MEKKDIRSMTPEELEAFVVNDLKDKKFRARQIYDWMHVKCVQNFDEMTNLSKVLRQKLSENATLCPVEKADCLISQIDGTRKYLFRMEDGSTYNAADDPRVTKVGRFLRKTSLDEIPQLLNVLIGDMALIGPRPDSAFYLGHYTPEERLILTVRPGITDWNQAVNRNSVGTKEKLQADIYYVKHLNFLFDIKVLWLTFKTVLSHKDVYRA